MIRRILKSFLPVSGQAELQHPHCSQAAITAVSLSFSFNIASLLSISLLSNLHNYHPRLSCSTIFLMVAANFGPSVAESQAVQSLFGS